MSAKEHVTGTNSVNNGSTRRKSTATHHSRRGRHRVQDLQDTGARDGLSDHGVHAVISGQCGETRLDVCRQQQQRLATLLALGLCTIRPRKVLTRRMFSQRHTSETTTLHQETRKRTSISRILRAASSPLRPGMSCAEHAMRTDKDTKDKSSTKPHVTKNLCRDQRGQRT